MSYVVLDLETNTKTHHQRKANPFYNDIVAIGYKWKGFKVKNCYIDSPKKQDVQEFFQLGSRSTSVFKFIPNLLANIDIIIGHNLTFDLLYLWQYKELQDFFKRGGRVWDTMITEYILTGQEHTYPGLRDIAVNKYGCPPRDKLMEEYWDKDTIKVLDWSSKKILYTFPKNTTNEEIAKFLDNKKVSHSVDIIHGSIDTKDIPRELVLEDVKNDVLDTERVALHQLKIARKNGQYELIRARMDGLLAQIECEYNGMYIDRQKFLHNKETLEFELQIVKSKLEELVGKYESK